MTLDLIVPCENEEKVSRMGKEWFNFCRTRGSSFLDILLAWGAGTYKGRGDWSSTIFDAFSNQGWGWGGKLCPSHRLSSLIFLTFRRHCAWFSTSRNELFTIIWILAKLRNCIKKQWPNDWFMSNKCWSKFFTAQNCGISSYIQYTTYI